MRVRSLPLVLAALATVSMAANSAWAVIEALMPLSQVIKDSEAIAVASIEKLDLEKPAAVLTVGETLKGKTDAQRLPVSLKGEKPEETKQLLERLTVDLPIILFFTKAEGDARTIALGYSNGTWFQVIGHPDGKQLRWGFTHLEPFLPRTYKGPTNQMRAAIIDAIAGKKKPPLPNPKEKPGLGPTIAESAGK